MLSSSVLKASEAGLKIAKRIFFYTKYVPPAELLKAIFAAKKVLLIKI
jgi:hypothetical protein